MYDPNLINDFTNTTKKNKENTGMQLLQAIILDDLKQMDKKNS